jgi:hypothetical protein
VITDDGPGFTEDPYRHRLRALTPWHCMAEVYGSPSACAQRSPLPRRRPAPEST